MFSVLNIFNYTVLNLFIRYKVKEHDRNPVTPFLPVMDHQQRDMVTEMKCTTSRVAMITGMVHWKRNFIQAS